jgi:FkbM family methyltransferase
MWARHEHERLPHRTGEYWLLDSVTSQTPRPAVMTFLDIGANLGNWTAQAIDSAARHHIEAVVHGFEPSPDTYEAYTRRFADVPPVHLHALAMSDRQGAAEWYVAGPLSGLNSLHPGTGPRGTGVSTTTVDAFVADTGVTHIDLVKCDAEGHDLTVLKGALAALRAGRIDAWQFEYNHRWLFNHACLRDVFTLIDGLPYRLARLYGNGLAVHDVWHQELDRFYQAHYVLIRHGSALEQLTHRARFTAANVAERVTSA